MSDALSELLALLREVGAQPRLYGHPVDEAELRAFAERQAVARIVTGQPLVAPSLDPHRCACGATPQPDESPGDGMYEQDGEQRYLCGRCWAIADGGGTGPPAADVAEPTCPRCGAPLATEIHVPDAEVFCDGRCEDIEP